MIATYYTTHFHNILEGKVAHTWYRKNGRNKLTLEIFETICAK